MSISRRKHEREATDRSGNRQPIASMYISAKTYETVGYRQSVLTLPYGIRTTASQDALPSSSMSLACLAVLPGRKLLFIPYYNSPLIIKPKQ